MANKYRRSPAEPCARRRRRAARWETRAGDTAIPSPALSRVDSRRVSGPGPAERRDPRSSTMFMVAPSPTRGRAKVAPAPDPQSLSPAPGAGAGPTLRERGPLGRRLSRACARPSRPREVGFPPRRPPRRRPDLGPQREPSPGERAGGVASGVHLRFCRPRNVSARSIHAESFHPFESFPYYKSAQSPFRSFRRKQVAFCVFPWVPAKSGAE